MLVARTHDMQLVAEIATHPAIWPHLHDDGTPEDWAPVDHEAIYWMLVRDDDDAAVGVFMVHPLNSYCFEMHTALLPRTWGQAAKEAAQLLLAWAFTETPCLKMVTNVPAYNRAALRYARAGGMTEEGINRASYMRNGVLVDQIMLGITKQEWKSCQ